MATAFVGRTFSSDHGRISYLKTITASNLPRFVRDTLQLDLDSYDLIITDFEPITRWAHSC